jgi:hypothetical protein
MLCCDVILAVDLPVTSAPTLPASATATVRPSSLSILAVVIPTRPPPTIAMSTSTWRTSRGKRCERAVWTQ